MNFKEDIKDLFDEFKKFKYFLFAWLGIIIILVSYIFIYDICKQLRERDKYIKTSWYVEQSSCQQLVNHEELDSVLGTICYSGISKDDYIFLWYKDKNIPIIANKNFSIFEGFYNSFILNEREFKVKLINDKQIEISYYWTPD